MTTSTARRREPAAPRSGGGIGAPFAALPHDLRKDPALRGHHKAILLAAALLEYARDKPSCWPSNRRLVEDLGCSPRTVPLALAALRRAGGIRVEQGPDGRRIWLTWREAHYAPSPSPVAPDRAQAVALELRKGGEEERPESDSCSGGTPPPAGEKGEIVASADELDQLEQWARGSDPVLARFGRAGLAAAGVVEPVVADAAAPEGLRLVVETLELPAVVQVEPTAPPAAVAPTPEVAAVQALPAQRAGSGFGPMPRGLPRSRRGRGARNVLEGIANPGTSPALPMRMIRPSHSP